MAVGHYVSTRVSPHLSSPIFEICLNFSESENDEISVLSQLNMTDSQRGIVSAVSRVYSTRPYDLMA